MNLKPKGGGCYFVKYKKASSKKVYYRKLPNLRYKSIVNGRTTINNK